MFCVRAETTTTCHSTLALYLSHSKFTRQLHKCLVDIKARNYALSLVRRYGVSGEFFDISSNGSCIFSKFFSPGYQYSLHSCPRPFRFDSDVKRRDRVIIIQEIARQHLHLNSDRPSVLSLALSKSLGITFPIALKVMGRSLWDECRVIIFSTCPI